MYRLIYTSRSTRPIDWNLVQEILHASDKNNVEREITGVLLATKECFLQVLEGRSEDVSETFVRIVRDLRHDDIKLISFNVAEKRLFEVWAMRGIGVFDLNKDLERQLIAKYGGGEDGVHFPQEEWQVLAMINDIDMVQNP